MEISKQKFIALIAAIVIIIIGGIMLDARKGEEEEGALEESMSAEELSGFLPIEFKDWQNPEEPWQSPPLEKGEIPEGAIEIGVTTEGFLPSSFEVKKGEKVVLTVTSQDRWVHVFKFKDKSLDGVAVGLASGETRAIMFYAPLEPGEYEFYCSVPGHERRGERGMMIVK